MMIHARASIWLWICVALIFCAQLGRTASEETSPSISSPPTSGNYGAASDGDKGSSKTREALAQLRAIKQSGGRLSRFDKKSGVIGSLAHYAKKGFILLFMNGPSSEGPLVSDTPRKKMSKPLARAVDLLEEAATVRDPDALFLLAEMNFHGNYSHPRDYKRAFELYHSLASLTGNHTAQHMVGFMYATGVGNAVERDQAKALIHHTFAAQAGNTRSEMTVAFRHHAGIGTPRNCQEAVGYYKRVADKAIQYARSGPPGGLPLMRDAYHISENDGGPYGEGASYSSSGHNAYKGGPGSDQHSPIEDVIEYYDVMARKGDLRAMFTLARLNYDGSRSVKANFKTSRKYFSQIARKYWNRDDRVISDDSLALGKTAAKAAAYLGRFYLRGEGVPQNFDKAMRWFKLGVTNGDAYCQYEMGLMYLLGLGVQKDVVMAADYFKQSAQQNWPAAQVNLGKLFLDQGDLKTAVAYFELALRHGHIEAFYHLAEINNFGVGRDRSCDVASSYYKVVVEKVEALHSSFDEANRAYEEGDQAGAVVKYMMAAEQGYEIAQANVAYLLDEHKSILSFDRLLPWKKESASLLRNAVLALVYWTRSSKQFNIDSTVKMGDYYLKGDGVPADSEKAAQCYQSAAEMHPTSAQALWNLGWMHENGLGVDQDFHLAHRLYLEAGEANSESYLPVKLSILKLRARSWWSQMTDGKVNPIQPEPEEPTKHNTWGEWLAQFLSNAADDASAALDDTGYADTLVGSDDYDLIDEFNGALLETIVMLALAAGLAALVYYRQARQQEQVRARAERDRRQREEDDGNAVWQAGPGAPDRPAHAVQPRLPGQQPDGGFFPQPGDPEFDVWRAGAAIGL